MTTTFNIPVNPVPVETFVIDLDGHSVRLKTRWNPTIAMWFMDISGITFETTVNGIALVPGVKLLEPYAIRELGEMYLVDLNDTDGNPDFDSFGDRFQLLYIPKG
jgi:hypothetical protein